MRISILDSVENILTRDGTKLEGLYERFGTTRYKWHAALNGGKGCDAELRRRIISEAIDAAPRAYQIVKDEINKLGEDEEVIKKEID